VTTSNITVLVYVYTAQR